MKREKTSIILQEILLVILTIIIFIPIYYFVIGSLKTRTDIVHHPLLLTPEFLRNEFAVSADKVKKINFIYVWNNIKMGKSLLNTAFITLVSLVGIVIAGSLAGFAISRIKRALFEIYYALLVAFMVIPFIGCLIPLVKLTDQLHVYGSPWAVILVQIAWNLPFSTFLFTGFMAALPKELEESAYIDGCTMLGTYFKIFLPLLTPVISTCCIRAGVGIWNDFLCTSTMVNQVNTPTLMVGLSKFFGTRSTEYGYAFAGIILASLPMIILFICLQKNFIKGLTAGAVKG